MISALQHRRRRAGRRVCFGAARRTSRSYRKGAQPAARRRRRRYGVEAEISWLAIGDGGGGGIVDSDQGSGRRTSVGVVSVEEGRDALHRRPLARSGRWRHRPRGQADSSNRLSPTVMDSSSGAAREASPIGALAWNVADSLDGEHFDRGRWQGRGWRREVHWHARRWRGQQQQQQQGEGL